MLESLNGLAGLDGLINHVNTVVTDGVALEVEFLERTGFVQQALEEGVDALSTELVQLEVELFEVGVDCEVLFEGGTDGGFDEVLAHVETG